MEFNWKIFRLKLCTPFAPIDLFRCCAGICSQDLNMITFPKENIIGRDNVRAAPPLAPTWCARTRPIVLGIASIALSFLHADLHLQFEIATSMHNLALTPQPPPRPLTPISSLPFAGCCLSVQPRRNELLDPTLRQRSVQLLVLRSHGPARHNVAFRRKRGGGLAIILTFFCAFDTHWLRRSGGCQASVYS